MRVEGTRVLVTLSPFISSWLIQCCLHNARDNLRTSGSQTNPWRQRQHFWTFLRSGSTQELLRSCKWPPQWARRNPFSRERVPRPLGTGWETTARAGARISEGSRRTSLWMYSLCLTWFKRIQFSPGFVPYLGRTWRFPSLAVTLHNTLQFSLLLGLCLLFKAPTFNSVREKLQ